MELSPAERDKGTRRRIQLSFEMLNLQKSDEEKQTKLESERLKEECVGVEVNTISGQNYPQAKSLLAKNLISLPGESIGQKSWLRLNTLQITCWETLSFPLPKLQNANLAPASFHI